MKLINKAYTTLSDPRKRFEYDNKNYKKTNSKDRNNQKTDTSFWGAPSNKLTKNKSKRVTPILVFLICLALSIVGLNYLNKLSRSNDINNVHQNEINLRATISQIKSLPSTSTKSKADWDTYFSEYTTKLQDIVNKSNGTYQDKSLNNLNKDINKTAQDDISVLNLLISSTDLSFKITDDKTTLQNSQDNLNTTIADNANTCGYGSVVCYGVNSDVDRHTVEANQATLDSDQKAYNDQIAQINELSTLLSKDWESINDDLKVLGFNN